MYGFLLVFFSNFVPKMHRFWDIRLQKCRDLEKRVRGPSRSLEISLCDRAHDFPLTYYSEYGSISCRFWGIQCHDLEIWVRGHSRLLKVVPFDRLCMVSYYCSLVTLSLKCTVFEIFDFKNVITLKTGLGVCQGHWKYLHSIECIRLPIDVL